MITVNLQQGSPEWLEWRRHHIGASDVPAIMGTSDFSNPVELWERKTGRKDAFKGNYATDRGQKAEPTIRRLYEELYNVKVTSPVAEYSDWNVLSASLDGYSEELGLIAEFKYPGQAKHELAKQGIVPSTYVDQVQAQLLVSGADTCHYVSYDGFGIAVVVVKADAARQAEILTACKAFWKCIEEDVRPDGGGSASPKGDNLEVMSRRYIELIRLSAQVEEEKKLIKKRITEIVPDKKASFYGLRLIRSERAGAIDYGRIPELESVDIEAYRKAPVVVTTLEIDGSQNA